MRVKCYWMEEIGLVRRYLRRYHADCKSNGAMNPFDEVEVPPKSYVPSYDPDGLVAIDDLRWPTMCGCGKEFDLFDPHQVFARRLYRRQDTGEILTVEEATPGAMYNSWWCIETLRYFGADGKCLTVKLPPNGHSWIIDGVANNCTKLDDKEHRCWCRHGEVPNITVDKKCNTCDAGGGSILTDKWHGHLVNGELIECK